MKRVDERAKRVLVLAPSGRDGAIARSLLAEVGIACDIVPDLPALVETLKQGAGSAIIAEEALQSANITALAGWLGDQPAWSDFPIILLTRHGGGLERNASAQRWAELLGNVTVIERPFHPTTLTAAVASAARSRYRQYEARARAEKLREGEERLNTAMRAASLGAWSLDLTTSTLDVSSASKAHYGRGAEEPFDFEAFKAAVHPDDWPSLETATRDTVATGRDYWVTYRTTWPDGSQHWIDARGQPLRSTNGAIFGMTGVTADITARKTADLDRERLMQDLARQRSALSDLNATLEERVAQRTTDLMSEVAARELAQEQLRQAQKMESIGQLTGGIAHDFNNLLMVVTSALTLLQRRVPDTPQVRQLIEGAVQAANRGASLTQRLLAFARQQALKTTSVDLGALVSGMRDLLDRSLGPLFRLQISAPENLPAAEVDANQLELAILNLVINARDAMAEGGTIALSIRFEPHAAEGSARRPDFLVIEVKDSGTGMSPDILTKAVEPFFSTKAVGKGTGLGLSMVHGLAVQLGGEFVLESEAGKGTTATIRVPRAETQSATSPHPASAFSDIAHAHILLVDDDPLVAVLTAEMLKELGHSVAVEHSAEAGLARFKNGEHFDILITDYLMPDMTGIALEKAVRAIRPNTPVLIATGYAEATTEFPDTVSRISKPYDLQGLRRALSGLAANISGQNRQ